MSFGFSVSDFVALGNLTFQLYKSIKDAPGEFREISRELGSFHIVTHEMQDQAQEESSLLNRRGTGREQELLSLCANMHGSLNELDVLFKKYQNMGKNAWLRVQLGQQELSTLRVKLTLHIGCINQFMSSLTMAAVGRMEPMMEQILRILRDSARGEHSRAQTILSAHRTHSKESWAPVELELRTEGIPVDFIKENRDRIEVLVDEVVQEEGFGAFEDIAPGDSVSQRLLPHEVLSTPQHPHQPKRRQRPSWQLPLKSGLSSASSSIPINATPAQVEAATISLMNQGFDLRNISKPKRISFTSKSRKTNRRNNDMLAEALCWAAKMDNETALRLILQKDADPSAKHDGTAAVAYAVQNENDVMLRLLLDQGAGINSTRSDGKSLIQIAVSSRNEAITRLLLERGPYLGRMDFDENCPLHLAIKDDLPATVKLLLDSGAVTDARNTARDCPLHLAIALQSQRIVALLLDKGAAVEAPNKQGDRPLHLAVANRDQATVGLLLQKGASLEIPNKCGEYPIHLAAKEGDNMMSFLLQKGASVKSRTMTGSTPLHLAAAMGHLGTVNLLLERGADIEARNTYASHGSPTTPLHLAIIAGQKAVEFLLKSRGADDSKSPRPDWPVCKVGPALAKYYPLGGLSVDEYLATQLQTIMNEVVMEESRRRYKRMSRQGRRRGRTY